MPKNEVPRKVGEVEISRGSKEYTGKPFYCPPYEPMVEWIPEGQSMGFEITHFELTEEDIKRAQLLSYLSFQPGEMRWLEPAKYCHLNKVSRWADCIMSDTPMERRTNLRVIEYAHGDVLLAGLGIGMLLVPLFKKPEVQSITVLEIELAVIDLVWPYIEHPKMRLEHADIFEWEPPEDAKYDIIYFDIWNDICGDNYPETIKLHKKFSKYRKPGGWIGSWRRADHRKQHTGKWRDDTKEGWKALA